MRLIVRIKKYAIGLMPIISPFINHHAFEIENNIGFAIILIMSNLGLFFLLALISGVAKIENPFKNPHK